MIEYLPPFLIYLFGAMILPWVPAGNLRSAFSLVVPVIGALLIWGAPAGNNAPLPMMGLDLELMRVDGLSRIFGLVFSLAGFLALIYAWHLRDWVQQTAALLYSGAAIGAVFAGDLITLFFFWEGTAIASVFLIWARGTEGAYHTGMRYLMVQIGSGVILIAGVALYYSATGSIGFEALGLPMTAISEWTALEAGLWLIFLSFGIKCAFPLLHNWLPDAYPAATVTGTVFLSIFTTKLAVYALARAFPGVELLIYVGVIMALFPLLYCIVENDLRRVLSYAINIQLGFMVIGVGLGTELALNGVAAHAFAHIMYKSLLFMSVGAVLYRTGTAKSSELGGLFRTMPLTMIFAVLGALSISTPLFGGFVGKSPILSAAAHEHYYLIWGALVVSSAGVFVFSGLKIPYFAFFAKDSGRRPQEAPAHMLLAMGLVSAVSIIIGFFPSLLYDLLPFPMEYEPYTTTHVVTQLQLLAFSALAFVVLIRSGLYPAEIKAVHLDSDWLYRKFGTGLLGYVSIIVAAAFAALTSTLREITDRTIVWLHHSHGPDGARASSWPLGQMVLYIAALLGFVLLVIFVG